MFRLHSRTGHRRHLLLGAATVATLLAVAASAQAAPFVYVTNELSGTVSQFNARAGGLLAPLVPATVAAPTRPLGVAVSPDGQSVYVANHDSTGVSQYDVGAGGRLSQRARPRWRRTVPRTRWR